MEHNKPLPDTSFIVSVLLESNCISIEEKKVLLKVLAKNKKDVDFMACIAIAIKDSVLVMEIPLHFDL